jgi:hypothetical protein
MKLLGLPPSFKVVPDTKGFYSIIGEDARAWAVERDETVMAHLLSAPTVEVLRPDLLSVPDAYAFQSGDKQPDQQEYQHPSELLSPPGSQSDDTSPTTPLCRLSSRQPKRCSWLECAPSLPWMFSTAMLWRIRHPEVEQRVEATENDVLIDIREVFDTIYRQHIIDPYKLPKSISEPGEKEDWKEMFRSINREITARYETLDLGSSYSFKTLSPEERRLHFDCVLDSSAASVIATKLLGATTEATCHVAAPSRNTAGVTCTNHGMSEDFRTEWHFWDGDPHEKGYAVIYPREGEVLWTLDKYGEPHTLLLPAATIRASPPRETTSEEGFETVEQPTAFDFGSALMWRPLSPAGNHSATGSCVSNEAFPVCMALSRALAPDVIDRIGDWRPNQNSWLTKVRSVYSSVIKKFKKSQPRDGWTLTCTTTENAPKEFHKPGFPINIHTTYTPRIVVMDPGGTKLGVL